MEILKKSALQFGVTLLAVLAAMKINEMLNQIKVMPPESKG